MLSMHAQRVAATSGPHPATAPSQSQLSAEWLRAAQSAAAVAPPPASTSHPGLDSAHTSPQRPRRAASHSACCSAGRREYGAADVRPRSEAGGLADRAEADLTAQRHAEMGAFEAADRWRGPGSASGRSVSDDVMLAAVPGATMLQLEVHPPARLRTTQLAHARKGRQTYMFPTQLCMQHRLCIVSACFHKHACLHHTARTTNDMIHICGGNVVLYGGALLMFHMRTLPSVISYFRTGPPPPPLNVRRRRWAVVPDLVVFYFMFFYGCVWKPVLLCGGAAGGHSSVGMQKEQGDQAVPELRPCLTGMVGARPGDMSVTRGGACRGHHRPVRHACRSTCAACSAWRSSRRSFVRRRRSWPRQRRRVTCSLSRRRPWSRCTLLLCLLDSRSKRHQTK